MINPREVNELINSPCGLCKDDDDPREFCKEAWPEDTIVTCTRAKDHDGPHVACGYELHYITSWE